MNLSKRALTAALAMAVAGPALADGSPLSANIGVVSNYVWRGVTQTQNKAAVQGGIDYAHPSGLYLGTWVSNIDWGASTPSYEWDLYGGYKGSAGDFGYNLGVYGYLYPDGKDANFYELQASGTWKLLTLGVDYTVDGDAHKPAPFRSGDFYYYGTLSFDLPVGLSLGATLGHYDFKDFGSQADYTNWEVSLSKDAGSFGSFSLNYDQTDAGSNAIVATDSKGKLWVGWKKTF
jgi:uncharacterized protein (TIGR02001 family)